MKHVLVIVGLGLFLVGCSTASVKRALPDGSEVGARTVRFLWKTEAFKLHVVTPDGIVLDVQLGKSASDDASIKAGAEGLAKGAVKGMSPLP